MFSSHNGCSIGGGAIFTEHSLRNNENGSLIVCIALETLDSACHGVSVKPTNSEVGNAEGREIQSTICCVRGDITETLSPPDGGFKDIPVIKGSVGDCEFTT